MRQPRKLHTHSSTSCLENPMDRGAWCRLLSMGSQSRAWLSDFTSLTIANNTKTVHERKTQTNIIHESRAMILTNFSTWIIQQYFKIVKHKDQSSCVLGMHYFNIWKSKNTINLFSAKEKVTWLLIMFSERVFDKI